MDFDVSPFPIVGIGASAGGIQALEQFFKPFPLDCGLCFVIVTHLSPDRESLLHEVVAHYTPIPVLVAEERMRVVPNTIYVMPANTILTIEDGRLCIRRPSTTLRERNPIDLFFTSLARYRGERAVGIVLSGGGADGTLGIKAIKESGGLTFAQTADGTKPLHADMPRSAISAGMVDHAIPVQEMAPKIIAYQRSLALVDTANGTDMDAETRKAVYDILRKQMGHDFSGYKTNTFIRRLHRRMHILQIKSLAAYVERIEEDKDEVMELFRDLLINVTNFFRDPEAFEALASGIIPLLFKGRNADDTIRVWVPGCATGEEVYSLGMLLREHMDTLRTIPRVQIFATDIDDVALIVARSARYPEALLENVSAERRKRFFVQEGDSFTVGKEVRDLCIFSPHSVIRDPPFSRIDLVSCRNLLIYFGGEIQNQVLPIFHYALRSGGYLFLGTSENIGRFGDLFAAVDKKQRIFQARDHGATKRLPTAMYGAGTPPFVVNQPVPSNTLPLRNVVEARVLDHFAPAHVVINGDGDVVYSSQRTGKYLEIPYGPPSRQIMAMARKGLRLDLRSALHDAIETRQAVIRDNVVIDDDGGENQIVKLTIEPLPGRDGGEALFLVLFEDLGLTRAAVRLVDRNSTDSVVADLDRELRDARERLQSMIEEYETAFEELKSSNEELVSVNEELQSTNEEMEASKEELQSLNEELQTVNSELTSKLDDLDHANGDLRNLFESTQIATVFLDQDLVIRSFTPAVSRIFRLIPSDRGRPLTDFAVHPAYPALQDHVRQVFKTGETFEHRIAAAQDQARYLVRLMPYRDTNQHTEGVVVTFIDITTLADAEERQALLISELNHRARDMLTLAMVITRDMKAEAAPTERRDTLIGRLNAMTSTYELVARENFREVGLRAIVAREVMALDTGRITFDGPAVLLTPKASLALGTVIHELATNALKYGALSNEKGCIGVRWSKADDSQAMDDGKATDEARGAAGAGVTLVWTERHGPPLASPMVPGFGLKLIEREIVDGLKGSVTLDEQVEGLSITLAFAG